MKITTRPLTSQYLALACASLALLSLPAKATPYTFTNADANGSYTDANNWSTTPPAYPGKPGGDFAPDLSNGNTATLSTSGAAVTYDSATYGDLIISNGGVMQINNGSFTQNTGGSWIQLGQQGNGASTGNGTIFVNGGTFNQGTDGNSPFSLTGAGNLFNIANGAANFTNGFSNGVDGAGLTYNQSGGAVTVTGGNFRIDGVTGSVNGANANGQFLMSNGTLSDTTGEFQFDGFNNATINGGTLSFQLITGVNHSPGVAITNLNLGGGLINISSGTGGGIYGASTSQYVNFTTGSTAAISFNNGDSLATIQAYITSGGIEYQNTVVGLSDFAINNVGGNEVLTLDPSLQAVPEPSTYALLGAGISLLFVMVRRRATKTTV